MQLRKQFVAVLPSMAGAFTATLTGFFLNAGFHAPNAVAGAPTALAAPAPDSTNAVRRDARSVDERASGRSAPAQRAASAHRADTASAGERTTTYSGTFEVGPRGVEAVVLVSNTAPSGAREVSRARVAFELSAPKLQIQKETFRTEPAPAGATRWDSDPARAQAGTATEAVARLFIGALADAGGFARAATAISPDGLRGGRAAPPRHACASCPPTIDGMARSERAVFAAGAPRWVDGARIARALEPRAGPRGPAWRHAGLSSA